ncbi:hypothetical protein [Undibacterium sp. WLX3042]|uniref:hypothetical protein n=1 Tax=Undibacterium sp. WLX3042 TaxID=3412686 RepID=UPI003C2AE1CF
MDFSDRQQEPGKKFLGIGLVIAFHVVLVYALLNGLGTAFAPFLFFFSTSLFASAQK